MSRIDYIAIAIAALTCTGIFTTFTTLSFQNAAPQAYIWLLLAFGCARAYYWAAMNAAAPSNTTR